MKKNRTMQLPGVSNNWNTGPIAKRTDTLFICRQHILQRRARLTMPDSSTSAADLAEHALAAVDEPLHPFKFEEGAAVSSLLSGRD